ncbi:MAG TPA: FAD-dependent oxidoreductase, partial [Cryomorphaceae bacterium]|nr:FAD-dependent oxidoreductase [Cryomorphaceae bacterium]
MSKNTSEFDSIIIGTGQAGTPLASALANEGRRVAIIEKGHLGGTCVNTGCTPTKTYVASAKSAWVARNAPNLGVSVSGTVKVDLKAVKSRKDKLLEESRKGIEQMTDAAENIALIRGMAKFKDEKIIEVNGENLQADQIFINVGARPRIPEGFDSVKFLTNESILELEEVPQHLIIIGGSYIGLEFAQIFRRFGSAV